MDETISLNITAQLADFRKEMAQIPGVTEKEAKKMVETFSANFKRAAAKAKAAARRVNGEFDRSFSAIRQGAGAVFGGVVNDIDDVVGAMGGLATVAGPAGVAVAAVAASATAGAIGLVALETAALDSVDALQKLGVPVDPAMAASIEEANAAVWALGAAFDQVVVTLGAQFSPLVTEAAAVVLHFGYQMADAIAEVSSGQVTLESFAKFVVGEFAEAFVTPLRRVAQFGLAIARLGEAIGADVSDLRRGSEYVMEYADSFVQARVDAVELDGFLADLDPRVRSLTNATREAVQARNAHGSAVKAEKTEVQDLAAMYDHLARAQRNMTDGSMVDQEEAWSKMLDQTLPKIEESSAGVTASVSQDLQQLSSMVTSVASTSAMVTGTLGALIEQSFDQAAARAERMAQTAQTARDKAIDAYRTAREDFEANADSMTEADRRRSMARLAALSTEVKAAKKASRDTNRAEKEALLDSFRAQQVTAAVQAAVQSAINFGSLIPAFSYLGPWAPAAAGGIAATVLGVQQAAIWSQAPPAFYTGGMAPQETTATLHQGESVLNRRATQALGPDVINAINQGRAQMGGSGATVVNLDSRLLATIAHEGRRRDSPMPTRLGSMYGVG